MQIDIKPCTIMDAVLISRQIPELKNPYGEEEYEKRFANTPHLILAVYLEGRAAGFKAGYERDGYFYSWMGGVLPAFRRHGIAQMLAEKQEAWARKQGYSSITFKTRNVHKGMLIFAIGNGFEIIGVDTMPDSSANRIWLKKVL